MKCGDMKNKNGIASALGSQSCKPNASSEWNFLLDTAKAKTEVVAA